MSGDREPAVRPQVSTDPPSDADHQPSREPPGQSATEARSTSAAQHGDGLGRLKAVSLDISVELARVTATVADVLALGPGSIVSFDPPDTSRAEVFIGRKLVALGEPVAIDDQVGVRITEFLSTPASGRSG